MNMHLLFERTVLLRMEKGRVRISTGKMIKRIIHGLLLLFISCSTTHKEDVHIVPALKKTSPPRPVDQPPPPPPIRVYYLTFNFLADSAGQIYYYPYRARLEKCCWEDDADALPEFIGLQPKDMVHLPTESVEAFIRLNVLTVNTNDRWAAIASVKDTITSPGLTKMIASFSNKSNEVRWVFRKATQEEKVVLEYKQLNKNYNPDQVVWDRTTIIILPKETKAK
jgi:hypothetical protein